MSEAGLRVAEIM